MPKDTYSDILGYIAQALVEKVGVVVSCHDPEKLRQRFERGMRELSINAPISILTRAAPLPCVILVKTEFMNGKKLNVEKASEILRSGPRPDESPPDPVQGSG